jgi:exodeoxyribonuclease V alpha subunit
MVDPPVAASIEGVVERVIFRSEDAAFGVLLVRKEEGSPAVKVAGPVGDAAEGALWRFTGAIEDHPKYGERLVAALAHPVVPETREGIRRYLSALGVKGLGAKSVDRLLDAFGDATLDALSKDEPPKVKGVASKVVLELREIVRRDRARADALSFLASAGLGPQISRRVFERFGASAVVIARANPFVFADEIRGVGFATADAAARKLGFPPEHPSRLRAGVLHALRSAAEQGHAGLPETRLIAAGTRLLGLDDATVSGAVSTAETLGDVVADDAGGDETLIYAPPLHAAECEAARLSRALSERRPILDPSIDVPTLPTGLSEEQREAVALLLRKPFALLTGGPGVGKTTVLRAWADSVAALGANPVLAAPTGRASRRMEEATGRPASTLHRLLRIPPSDVLSKEPPEPIDCDALAIDEASMLDLVLFVQVLRALPPHATLVLVGDPHQLPSVGPVDVLNALLRSGVAPAARLTRVFRQERGGVLVANAHRVLSGLLPEPAPIGADSDFYFMERDDAEEGALLVRDLVVERLPRRYGFDPREDVQTLSPMHRGAEAVAARRASSA